MKYPENLISIGKTPVTGKEIVLGDHVYLRAEERLKADPSGADKAIRTALSAADGYPPFRMKIGTVDVLDYTQHIFLGMNSGRDRIRIQTIGRQGEMWPIPGHVVFLIRDHEIAEKTWKGIHPPGASAVDEKFPEQLREDEDGSCREENYDRYLQDS